MSRVMLRCGFLVFGLGFVCAAAYGGDWPHWRGPKYDGISDETNFKKSFTSLKKLWEHPIGSGYSGISVVDGRAYTCGIVDDKQALFCLDANSGKVIWTVEIEENFKDQWGNGARGTPTIEGGHAYIMGARGTVACYHTRDGSKVWSRAYEARPMWGYSGSVTVRGDLAIISTGGRDGALRALDKKSGREVWQAGSDKQAGYSTPYPFTFEGTEYVCGFLGTGAIVAELKTGKVALEMPWKTDWNVNAATPIFHDGHLWLGSGYSTGSGLFKLTKAGGQLQAAELWRNKVMLNKFQTPVLFEGFMYCFDERAFKCVEFANGNLKWRERGENGTVVIADGHIIALTEQGKLRVGPVSPEGFKATGEAQILDDRCWTVPTLVNGKLYARNLERMVCYEMKE